MEIGIVGASGAVGQEIIRLLEERNLPVKRICFFGSKRSQGITLSFRGEKIPIQTLSPRAFQGLDVVFFSAGSDVSKTYVNIARQEGALVIDNSSAFRQDPHTPLVIPEVNPEALEHHDGLICNPNCVVILLLTVLFPLHQVAKLKRIVLSTYQAASGAGWQAMQELQQETLAFLENRPHERKVIPYPYAFNLFLHNSPMASDQYVEEEVKIIAETRKILSEPKLGIAVTCVRVPVLRAHAESVNAEFHESISAQKAQEILLQAPGVTFLENSFAMPRDVAGQENVFCSRVREDLSQPNTLDLWIVGDQLLKGAALNAVQILETIKKTKKDPEPILSTL
ncbi:MAG: aspartate-semialdehyde dehydrogenase [Rhabdochlamydiaceae bacterium]|nr:aspartate-semialdehyde dehydrogenase [Rhabdochlamydiaceae bacterium]